MTDVDRVGPDERLDLRQVLVEIDEEVARRRASGDIPPGLERELDETFARFSPAAATGTDAASVIAAAERTAFVDVDVPTGSGLPGGPVVKKALRKGMAWYLRYLAQQTSAFNAAAVRALRTLDERVAGLEDRAAVAGPQLREALAARPGRPGGEAPQAALLRTAVEACREAPGRVVVADAGEGDVVRALVDAGFDAYGVEPSRPTANRALAAGLDVRVVEAADHLAGVAAGVLGGVVLSGVVDRSPAPTTLALAEAAALALAPGGTLVVLSTTPAHWARALDPVMADLTPGAPLHPETWSWWLTRAGLDVANVDEGPSGDDLVDLADDVPGAAAVNANNATLRSALFGPSSYTVVARRPR